MTQQCSTWSDKLKRRVQALGVEPCSAITFDLIRDEDGVYWLVIKGIGKMERLGK